MHQIYYIESNQLETLFQKLKKSYKVFSPVAKGPNYTAKADYSYKGLAEGESPVFNPYRAVEPLKSFFTYAQDQAAEYFNRDEPVLDSMQVIVFGVKSCDIAGHKVQDFVFLEGVEVDSLYRLRRDNTILISGDCTDFKDVCHCLAWDILPHPTEGFDLNFSPLNDGYLVEVGSKKGEGLIQQYQEYFTPAKETQIAGRRVKRENLIERLKRHLLPQKLVSKDSVQRLMREGYNLDTWQQFMLTCVECGGCNLICNTCHCFLLADKKEGNINKKVKVWDSCQYANFTRVAGGANPLKTRTQRLRNRFLKKFDFFVDNLGMPACCGCGRCIEVCPGKIDIREVLKDVAKKLSASK
ncbi:MAG: 4Fe-4S dicluster domain-containing protein [Candidatus Omnitrophica bacterium]|nr:4Fe-4S dicluster domain-containing protein [Candidatus Omnitrophota bacterium]MDD5592222.1 4Fe-4S dicluster domain-containing protein [Candidatus Omnitrophota bacterium]